MQQQQRVVQSCFQKFLLNIIIFLFAKTKLRSVVLKEMHIKSEILAANCLLHIIHFTLARLNFCTAK